MLELVLALSVLTPDAPLQSPSPFFLLLTEAAGGYEATLLNRSKKAQTYLVDPLVQPLEPILLDAHGKPCKLLDARAVASSDGRVWKKHYRRLEPDVRTVLAHAMVSGSPVDKFRLQAPPFECGYLEPGRYRLSFVWRSQIRRCDDCTAAEKNGLDKVWLGVIRSNEVEVVLR